MGSAKDQALDRALNAIRRGDLENGVKELRLALDLDPTDARTMLQAIIKTAPDSAAAERARRTLSTSGPTIH